MNTAQRRLAEALVPVLADLRRRALELEREMAPELAGVAPEWRPGARNLVHYLALRRADLRGLQGKLALLGLSRLARAEAHTLASLNAVTEALHALLGRVPPPAARAPVSIRRGGALLAAQAGALLGPPPPGRPARIMVTLPSEAADQPELLKTLLLAGMNVMRINCAHDEPAAWLRMIAHLREAERATGRSCRIHVDLAGPKLRTGPLRPAGRLAEFKPDRDLWGHILAPARVWITPRERPEAPPDDIQTVLPVTGALLAEARPGDSLALEDCRGGTRDLTLSENRGASWLALGRRHVYVREGAGCALFRDVVRLAQGRVGPLPEVVEPLLLRPGDTLRLTAGDQPGGPARLGEAGEVLEPASIPCTLDAVFTAVRSGQAVWFDDGRLGGVVRKALPGAVEIEITHAPPKGARLRPEKGINLPDTDLDIPALGEADLAHLAILAPHVDMVGLSFVRRPDDVADLRRRLQELGAAHLGVVLKIETRQGFENLPRLLLAGLGPAPLGVMVARCDLAVEIGFERLAEVQEEILWLCEAAHVPVIWATQVLESMAKRGLPSRAEVSDAAFGIRAECVMLNKGPYIVETTRFLAGVLARMSGHHAKRRPVMRRLAVSGGFRPR